MTSFNVRAIGRVESGLKSAGAAPRQPDEGAPSAWLVFAPHVREALQDIGAGDVLTVVTWMHLARRDVLRVHPRGDATRPQLGVFSTRSPGRPNPIGLHDVEVTAVDGLRVAVRHLEAIDGTPILDVKPRLDAEVSRR